MAGFFDILKLIFKLVQFRYEQRKLTTNIFSVIKTRQGLVRGLKRNTIWGHSYYSFERIPFAKPPLEELRFKAPVPAEPWAGELDCTGPAEKPMQSFMLFRKYTGSEDCLYLNVYATELQPAQLRPVMVWIYGGGFQVGEASRDLYSPDFFMAKGIVLVSIAYRLGALGFLSLEDAEVNVPGNAGLKDQVMGLRWVKENIREFGGDPNNITLFGESAGAASTHWLTLSEQTKGLVDQVIIMSGSAMCPWALPPRNDWAFRLAQKLGFTGENKDKEVFKFLQTVKGCDIVNATSTLRNKHEKHHRVLFAFGPVIEPYETPDRVIAAPAYELMKTTWSNDIPMMLGGTSFEGLLFYAEVQRRPATLDEVGNCKNMLPFDLGDDLDATARENYGLRLKQTYFGEGVCNLENIFKFLDLESAREFWHPIYRTALARQRYATAPTYLYRFDFDSELGNAIRILLCGSDVRGACHGDDLCYIFYSMLSYRAPVNSPEYHVIRSMIDIWSSFARNGDPNCGSISSLKFEPLRQNGDVKCLNISDKTTFIDLPELAKLSVWNSFYTSDRL